MSAAPTTACALTGIGARLPAGQGRPDTRGPAQTWQALLTAESATSRYPAPDWEQIATDLHPGDRPDAPWPVAHLNLPSAVPPEVFGGLRSGEAALLSPTQALAMQVVHEALADAGLPADRLAGPDTGLYVATSSPDEALRTFAPRMRPSLPEITAGGAGMIATPIMRWLNTRGPVQTMDTSCSSSLYALDAARRDIATGRVETALVIALNTARSAPVARAFHTGGVLSPTGVCRPFDEKADGFVRGEAAVAIVLRAPTLAQQERDRVYALIEHTRTGADGRAAAVGAPSLSAQRELYADTVAEAGLGPEAIGYALAHGTATEAGDRVESRAWAHALKRSESDPVALGSVKGLWGHAEGGAGLTSVVAAALSLHHGQVPATAGHTTPRPRLAELGLRVPTAAEPWPGDGCERRAMVSSLGFSGALGTAVLRAAPSRPKQAATTGALALPVSGPTPEAVRERAGALADALQGPEPPGLGQVVAHGARRLDRGRTRACVVAGTSTQAWEGLHALKRGHPHPAVSGPATTPAGQRPRVVLAFGGHGASAPEMGRQLYRTDPDFAHDLDFVLLNLAELGGTRWHPLSAAPDGLAATQQATWAVQVAWAITLISRYDMDIDAVVGHSAGEVAAAHVSGALDLGQAAALVCARSQLLERITHRGGMLTAEIGPVPALDLALEYGVEVAAHNGPHLTVFSGSHRALERLAATLEERGARPRRLPGAPPAHSREVERYLPLLQHDLEGLRPQAGYRTMVSTCTGTAVEGTGLDAAYWARQVRSPVQWEQAITHMSRSGPLLVVEASPNPVLAVPTTQTRARHHLNLTITAPGHEPDSLAQAVGALHTHGAALAWPYPAAPPVEMEPAPWDEDTTTPSWGQRVAELSGQERLAELTLQVHHLVQGLAPVSVGEQDRQTPLERLGLNSMDRLSLRSLLSSHLPVDASQVGEHEPTIASIAQAVYTAMPAAPPPKTG
ncbi:beta-ketoacyl synthase N-terminal-like domain-containing protein [Nocardiopsis kunsanensis]|uniref:beta-ketoacyl synthase N-terminal-like domain-containing protein n=1 Tax=Nocardiopsis kunsanensis TaxID=141693 RepID=UPI0003469071|nr:type I polyketide synthase [Nocardiopsis kunsanensis]